MPWCPLPAPLDAYLVSDTGQVARAAHTGPKVLRQSTSRGYPHICISHKGRKHGRTVHALVAAAFIGPRPDGMQINHRNGVKADNRASNLEYVTPSQNMKHAHATGLQSNRGERHSRRKLSDAAVIDIRARVARGETQKEVARMYGVTQSCVGRANSGARWGHVMADAQAKNLRVSG